MSVQYYYVVNRYDEILMVSSCYIDEVETIVDRYENVGCEVFATTKEKFELIERSTKNQMIAKAILGYSDSYQL